MTMLLWALLLVTSAGNCCLLPGAKARSILAATSVATTSSVTVAGSTSSSSTASKHSQLDFPAPPPDPTRQRPAPYLAICAVVKDQNMDIREWVHYHYWLGVQAFYIYDHGSSTPLFVELEDWIRSGIVRYNFFTYTQVNSGHKVFAKTAQGEAYQDCLRRARVGKHRWLAFFDVDEFLVKAEPERSSIAAILEEYKAYGGLVVNWRMFSSSGHKTRPRGCTLEAFTQCIPDDAPDSHNKHVKAIVNVPHVTSIGPTPHNFKYKPGLFAVNELFERRDGPMSQPVSVTRLALHHYVLKSEEEYQQKARRGNGSGGTKGADFWDDIERAASGRCYEGVAVAKACCSHIASGSALDPAALM